MAEEIIATTVIALLEKTIAAAADRFGLVPGFKDELTKMEGLVRDIQARIADAESKQSEDPIVLRWLKDFKGATLEAEIVLDELHYEDLRREVHKFKRGSVAKVCSIFSLFTYDVSFRVRMSHKVRGINVMLKDIKQNHDLLQDLLLRHDADVSVTVEAANRQTDSLPAQFVAGRSREESEIVDMLLWGSSNDNNPPVSVLPIVGMGGLGKTTLAKSVYNSEKIVNHFSKRSWVCVSEKFDAVDIFKGILESLKRGSTADMSSRDAIVHGIQEELSGGRFLFVLDDVWNEDSGLWDSFFDSLVGLNSAIGSCCVVTTRLQRVANLTRTSSFDPFVPGRLSHDDCWLIIGKKATKGGEMPSEFEVHKEDVLKKCQGLPLAAKAIGGLLSSQEKEDWVSAMEALKVKDVKDGDIMPILKLSYDYLPYPHIKKCFAYCSVFPKDTLMKGRELIELWMAEGYLQDDMQERTLMEEDGVGSLKLLLQSSLLEKKDDAYSDDLYQMHDLVHDLAESISEQKQHDGERHRHLALGERIYDWNEKSTLIKVVEGDVTGEMLFKYEHARVMHLFSREIKKLPNAISKLKHIRCLTLSLGGITSLPESLCKLYNLQTLRLSDCYELESLPRGLSNIISLRHLHFCLYETKFKMPPNMGLLTRLQTLEFFNVGEKKNGRGIEELGFMENLKGELIIRNLELIKGKEEATSAKLFKKKNLTKLELEWGSTTGRNNDNWEDVLEGLEPCPGLQELKIESFMGIRFPGWLGTLSALVSLGLRKCVNITELRYSGDSGFPNLKSLNIWSCPQLSTVRTSFPILEDLYVEDVQVSVVRDIISDSLKVLMLERVSGMTQLECSGDSGFPKLKTLRIKRCPQLSSVRTSFPILEELNVEDVQVSGVRDIISTTTNSLLDLSLGGVSGMTCLSDVIESSRLSSCLKILVIGFCDELTEIPSSTLESCTCLKSLQVYACRELVSCPLNLQQTPCLSVISFWDCPKLFTRDAVLPRGFQHLTNLEKLSIGPDNSEKSIDWEELETGCSTTLRQLYMSGSCRTQLPQQLQDFSSLVHLTIWSFHSLERLPGWLAKLTSLRELRLYDCLKLEHLPTDAIRSLTNLQQLHIEECPLLRETQGDEIKALPNLRVYWRDY